MFSSGKNKRSRQNINGSITFGVGKYRRGNNIVFVNAEQEAF